MAAPTKVFGLAAMVALGVGWLWLRSGDDSKVLEQPDAAKELVAPTTQTRQTVAPAAVPGSAQSPPRAPSAIQDERPAKITSKLFNALYGKVGATDIDYLVSKGLSREDSERIVLQGTRDWAKCQFDALLAQAAAQSMPRESVLHSLDAWDGTPRPPVDVDPIALLERATPCIEGVRQRAGLPFEPQAEAPRAE